jgi:hypothetical protein
VLKNKSLPLLSVINFNTGVISIAAIIASNF